MKRFKGKRKKTLKIGTFIKTFVIFFVLLLLKTIADNIKLTSNNEEFLLALLNDSNHHLIYKKQNNKLTNKLLQFITGFNIEDPKTILAYENTIYERDSLDLLNPPKLDSQMYYVKDPKNETINNPRVYIYNSHQQEEYNSDSYASYNIKPGVMMASYILRENLNKLGINTIVEEGNIVDFLNLNNWNYNYSYDASRYFINETLKNNPSIEIIIDLHRDSVIKKASTITINNKNYARTIFVVGLEHSNYQANLDTANKINQLMENKYPGLSRGVLTKEGEYVNGVYNQDISPNAILIEIGGYENTIEEVINTLDIFAPIIKEYLETNV